MNNINSIFKEHKEVSMTQSEKESVWSMISTQAFDEEPLNIKAKKPIISVMYYNGILSILKNQGLSFVNKKYAYSVLAGALILSGSISVFAEGALPGELLYPVKTVVIEKIKVAVAITPEEKAETEAKLAAKRLEEIEKLALVGKLDTSIAEQSADAFNTHVTNLENHLKTLEQNNKLVSIAKIGLLFQTKMAVHTTILKDIEIHNRALSSVKVMSNTKIPIINPSIVIHVENKIIKSISPVVIATKKAIVETYQIDDTSVTENTNKKPAVILHVDEKEAKNYLIELHDTVGIPEPIVETKIPAILPIVLP